MGVLTNAVSQGLTLNRQRLADKFNESISLRQQERLDEDNARSRDANNRANNSDARAKTKFDQDTAVYNEDMSRAKKETADKAQYEQDMSIAYDNSLDSSPEAGVTGPPRELRLNQYEYTKQASNAAAKNKDLKTVTAMSDRQKQFEEEGFKDAWASAMAGDWDNANVAWNQSGKIKGKLSPIEGKPGFALHTREDGKEGVIDMASIGKAFGYIKEDKSNKTKEISDDPRENPEVLAQAQQEAEAWADSMAGTFTSDATDFADYGGSRSAAIKAKTMENYRQRIADIHSMTQPQVNSSQPRSQVPQQSSPVQKPQSAEEMYSYLKSLPQNKDKDDADIRAQALSHFPGQQQPVAKRSAIDGLRTRDQIAEDKLKTTSGYIDRALRDQTQRSGEERSAQQGAMASGFGIDPNASEKERGMAYNNLAQNYSTTMKKIQSGELPNMDEMLTAIMFAEGKKDAKSVQTLNDIITRYKDRL